MPMSNSMSKSISAEDLAALDVTPTARGRGTTSSRTARTCRANQGSVVPQTGSAFRRLPKTALAAWVGSLVCPLPRFSSKRKVLSNRRAVVIRVRGFLWREYWRVLYPIYMRKGRSLGGLEGVLLHVRRVFLVLHCCTPELRSAGWGVAAFQQTPLSFDISESSQHLRFDSA